MAAKFVSNRDETIPLFKNPVLEWFSHIHPATPIIVYGPVAAFFFYRGFGQFPWYVAALQLAAGLALWTLTEYVMHRWVFHYQPKSDLGKYVHFLAHGVHHDYPRDSTRLVMPLLVSVPLAIAFYLGFRALLGPYTDTIFGAFLVGYIAYDSIHYATHHWPMKRGVGKFLKEYHLKHHYVDDDRSYGVSNPMWDYVFHTTPLPSRPGQRQPTPSEEPEEVAVA